MATALAVYAVLKLYKIEISCYTFKCSVPFPTRCEPGGWPGTPGVSSPLENRFDIVQVKCTDYPGCILVSLLLCIAD